MPSYRLAAVEGSQTFDLPDGRSVIVGRGVASDIALYDPTISRRHAELTAMPEGVQVRDLGSSNGTAINGARVAIGLMLPRDSITFGKVVFQLEEVPSATTPTGATPSGGLGTATPRSTIVSEVPVAPGAIQVNRRATASQLRVTARDDRERTARKLELLLEISQRLAGEFDLDKLLSTVADTMFEVMNVDRVSVLLVHETAGELVPRLTRARLADAAMQHVPRSIARKVMEERVAVLSHNAADDERFTGQSIVLQRVQSAMCSPLLGAGDEPLGLLYVDNLTAVHSFSDEDLQFLVAFSGIAGMAIANSRYADRLQRETMVRSNFERYFAPNVAAEISQQSSSVRPGGERRPVTVLFSDIRGFTSLAEMLSPEETATLLSDYFSVMVELIFEHGGTLDKFIGDAIMALWGAPIAHADDVDQAVAAARAMQEAVEMLNTRWREAGRPTLSVGIGINHGEAFAGNIGSARRLEYTVLGDAVNIAARLCSIAEGGVILASDAVRAAVRDPSGFEKVEGPALRGKATAVEVYRVI
jgi:adenylate cyclase